MKNVIWALIAIALVSCNSEPANFASVKGQLKNTDAKTIAVKGANYSKDIAVSEDGNFADTLKVADGMYMMAYGNEKISVFLKNGYDLELIFNDASTSDVNITYKGEGAETNNYIEEKRSFFISDYANPNSYFSLDKEAYEARLAEAKGKLNETQYDLKKVDTSVVSMVSKSDNMLFSYVESNYEAMHASAVKLAKGADSPTFTDYENFAGGTTSLSDLKGKYVYIDIWATWCGPCKAEIPSLKALEKDFHGKNIQFVSISVDNVDGKRGSRDSWLAMVKKEELGGLQLFADKDFRSEFIQEYGINSIPRFILIDPNGKIVDANAIRPSNPKINDYFKELGI